MHGKRGATSFEKSVKLRPSFWAWQLHSAGSIDGWQLTDNTRACSFTPSSTSSVTWMSLARKQSAAGMLVPRKAQRSDSDEQTRQLPRCHDRVARTGWFRRSESFRSTFEEIVCGCMDVGAQGKITPQGAAPKYDYTFDLRVTYVISSLATRQGHRRCLLLLTTRPSAAKNTTRTNGGDPAAWQWAAKRCLKWEVLPHHTHTPYHRISPFCCTAPSRDWKIS